MFTLKNKKPAEKMAVLGIVTAVAIVFIGLVFLGLRSTDEIIIGTPKAGFLAGVSFGVSDELSNKESEAEPIPPEYINEPEYVSAQYGFSLRYPGGFSVGEIAEGNGDMILFQNSNDQRGFQVFVIPYDEPATSLTAERIHKDLPNMPIREPQQFRIGDGISGIAFISESEAFGTSREVWFARGGHLFQASTYLESQELLQEILRTWRFE